MGQTNIHLTRMHEAMWHEEPKPAPVDADALYKKALKLAIGDGVEENLDKALDYAVKAANAGHSAAERLANDINHTLSNRGERFFVYFNAGHVARYDSDKHAFVMKRCFDCTESVNGTQVKAYEETDLDEECLRDPWQLGNSYSYINEELYNDFGKHWALRPLEGRILVDEEALEQFKACGSGYTQDVIDKLFTIETQEQIQSDLQTIQKPDDEFVGLYDAASGGVVDADGLIALAQIFEYGGYGVKSAAEYPDNHNEAVRWLLYAADSDYDKAIQQLYSIGYFDERLANKIQNPEPVGDEAAVIASTEKMTGDEVFELAAKYGAGRGVPRNYPFSENLLKIAVHKGSGKAQYMLMEFYEHDIFPGRDNYTTEETIEGYKKALDMGYFPAAKKIAELYLNLTTDVQTALEYLKLSGEHGDVESMISYIHIYNMMLRVGFIEGDLDSFNRMSLHFIKSLPQDDVNVLNEWGDIYSEGSFGVPVDYDKAWSYYEKAANKQDVFDTVDMLKRIAKPFATLDVGIDSDYPLPQNALQGSGNAMYSMAKMILLGKHGDPEKDHDRAMQLLQDGSDRFDPASMILLRAINSGDDEKVRRLLDDDGEFNKDDMDELMKLSQSIGDYITAGICSFALTLVELAENDGNAAGGE